jgi:hypothetical protein
MGKIRQAESKPIRLSNHLTIFNPNGQYQSMHINLAMLKKRKLDILGLRDRYHLQKRNIQTPPNNVRLIIEHTGDSR